VLLKILHYAIKLIEVTTLLRSNQYAMVFNAIALACRKFRLQHAKIKIIQIIIL